MKKFYLKFFFTVHELNVHLCKKYEELSTEKSNLRQKLERGSESQR